MRKKCTKRRFCDLLDERLNLTANHGKGLTMFCLTNLHTGDQFGAGVIYKKKESDKGLLITFCPWCGTNLLELFNIAGTGGKKSPALDRTHAP